MDTLKRYSFKQVFLFLIVCLSSSASAQSFSDSGISFGVKLGVSRMFGEVPKGSVQFINEFDHNLGFAPGIEISKEIAPKIQLAVDAGFTTLNGNSYTPDFSAEGVQAGIPADIVNPVEYRNTLIRFTILTRYYFHEMNSQSSLIPFISAGAGYLSYYSTLRYIETGEEIFGKGTSNYTKLSNPEFILGTGFKTNLSKRKYLLALVDLHFVGYDFLDVMHNFEENRERQKVRGLFAEVKIGFFFNTGSQEKSTGSSSSGKKNGGSSLKVNLPFAR